MILNLFIKIQSTDIFIFYVIFSLKNNKYDASKLFNIINCKKS